jgi:hypothetical protein
MIASWGHRVRSAAFVLLLCAWPPAPALAAELVMYRRDGCAFCLRFEREVAPLYGKTQEGKLLPLRRVDVPAGGVRDASLKEPVIAAPTFVLVDKGREIGRITGYLNDDMFWGLLGSLVAGMDKLDADPKP